MTFPPLPPRMAARIAAAEEVEARQAAVAEADDSDARLEAARRAEVEAHAFEASTGYSPGEWQTARESLADARDAAGYDPGAPVGSRGRPEVLVDGGSLTPTPHAHQSGHAVSRATVAGSLARPGGGVDELALARELSEAWQRDPVLTRARSAARRDEISRLELAAAAESSRSVRLPRGHDPEHSRACSGPVSNFEPGDPRRRDCTAGWPPPAGRCPCGCGAAAPVAARSRLLELGGLPYGRTGDW